MALDLDFLMYAVSVTLGICGLLLTVASWLRRDKRAADWAMAVGSTLAFMGAIGLLIAVTGVEMLQSDDAGFVVVGVGSMGVVVFTMGFAVDRISVAKKRKYMSDMDKMMSGQ